MAKINKPKVIAAPEHKLTQKVWNISDWPETSVAAQSLLLFGATVNPGESVEVPTERLKNSRRVEKEGEAQLIHVGELPPEGYRKWKTTVRALMPRGASRSHVGVYTPVEPKVAVESISQALKAKKKDPE